MGSQAQEHTSPWWERLLEEPGDDSHLVQLHDSDSTFLIQNVARYLHEGLKRGEPALVIGIAKHNAAILRKLQESGVDTDAALKDRRIVVLDAHKTLGRFMIEGRPDPRLMDVIIGGAVHELQTRAAGANVRTYGEMVGILWSGGRFSAAMMLEEFWNTLQESVDFHLYCSYPIDVLGKAFYVCDIDALLCSHSRMLPTAPEGDLEAAIDLAMDEVLGSRADELRVRMNAANQPSWAPELNAEALIIWLRKNARDCADEILGLARNRYRASALAS
jgi:hypothetical protein